MPGAEKTEEFVEPTLQRALGLAAAEMPFANHAGRITEFAQSLGQRCFCRRKAGIRIIWLPRRVAFVSKTFLITPRQQGGAAGGTNGGRNVTTRETNAVADDGIKIRRRDIFATVESDIVVTLIIR